MAYIYTAKEAAENASKRWKDQYGGRFHLPTYTNPKKTWGDIFNEIDGESDPVKINAAIGNNSWTTVSCSECHNDVEAVAVFDVNGGEYNHYLCKSCCMAVWK